MTSKKRVLIFVPTFPTLSETFIEREITKLIQLGNLDITVYSLNKGKNTTSEETLRHVVYRVMTWKDAVLTIPFIIVHLPNVIKAFFTILPNKNRNIIQTMYLFLKSLAYTKIFSEYKPDILYFHFMSESSTLGLVSSIVLNKPLAISGHAKDVLQVGGKVIEENSELIPQKVTQSKFVTICNKYAYQHVCNLVKDSDKKKVHLEYHGVDFDKLLAEPQRLEKPNVPVISIVGTRLVEKKGIKYLLEASRTLLDRGILHQVHLAGAGDKYESINKQISELGLENVVTIFGDGKGLSIADIIQLFKIADIYALPSIELQGGDVDGIATTLIEAAVFSLPIVATNAGSTQDLVLNNETGIIVSQRNSLELADALERLIKDPEYGKKLGLAAHAKARRMFDLDKNVRVIEKMLFS